MLQPGLGDKAQHLAILRLLFLGLLEGGFGLGPIQGGEVGPPILGKVLRVLGLDGAGLVRAGLEDGATIAIEEGLVEDGGSGFWGLGAEVQGGKAQSNKGKQGDAHGDS